MSSIAARLILPARHTDLDDDPLAIGLLVLLAWICAGAVAGSHWVPGSDVILVVAVLGMLVAIVLARVSPRGLTFWLATEVGLVVALFIGTAHHTNSVASDAVAWVNSVERDLNLALLMSMVIGAWLATAWTGYWVLRRGNIPVGIAPMAAVFAVQVIDDPAQNGITLLTVSWLVLAVMLLLRHTVTRLDRRWGSLGGGELASRIGIQGSRALVLLLVTAFVLPPLSTVDLSTRYFGGSGQTEGGLGGPAVRGNGASPAFIQTGYSERVDPGGTLVRSLAPVMEVTTDFQRTVYWRGLDLYVVRNGAWEVGNESTLATDIAANQPIVEDPYLARRTVHATVRVMGVAQNTIFWPGDPLHAGIATQVRGQQTSNVESSLPVAAVDGAYARSPVVPGRTYTVDASYSVATEAQLRSAGTAYPPIVNLLTHRGPRTGPIDDRVSALARQVAGSQPTPYDQAKAIETYLRTNLKYSLQVAPPPRGEDPVAYFLAQSHVGYCEYFASAMGEMVRSLGIPVRLVVGYGPGSSESPQDIPRGRNADTSGLPNMVRAADAHTWVEVFFPTYGWVGFEPTPDPLYPPLDRAGLDSPALTFPAGTLPAAIAPPRHLTAPRQPAPSVVPGLVVAALAGALLLLVALVVAVVARGPSRLRSPEAAWRRLGWLASRLGQPRRPSDTPIEFTGRLGGELPSLAPAFADLGQAYSQWCYRRGGLAEGQRRSAEEAWRRVRRDFIRQLLWPRRDPAAR